VSKMDGAMQIVTWFLLRLMKILKDGTDFLTSSFREVHSDGMHVELTYLTFRAIRLVILRIMASDIGSAMVSCISPQIRASPR
jgi:hypothetical protein